MKHQTIGLVVFVNDQKYAGELEIDRNPQVVWSDSPKADRSWTFVDQAGHFHAYDMDGELPTLENEPEHVDCDGACGGHCEGYSVPHYLCRICREEIHPGSIPGPHQFAMDGPTSWVVRVRGVGHFAAQYDDQVSVRILDQEGSLFGVARVHGGSVQGTSPESVTFEAELVGEGPLSRTDAG
jgi:hypothetical protein